MKLLITISFLLLAEISRAQQDPLYAQYLLNPLAINPAVAGSNSNLNLLAGYRMQWAGMEGQPNTLNVSAHSSFMDNKTGAGLLIVNERIGNVTNSEVLLSAAYKIRLQHGLISFGMHGGVQSFRTDNGLLNIYHPNDVAYTSGEKGTRVNIGAGLVYRGDDLFVGLSVPRLLPATFKSGGEEFVRYDRHYYLTAAWTYRYTADVWFKPSVMARGVKGAPLSCDIGLNVILHDRHMAGFFTRTLNTYGVLLQTHINDRFVFGYVFELPHGKNSGLNFPTHEVNIGMKLSVFSFHNRIGNNY